MYGNSRKAVSFTKELYQGKKEGQAVGWSDRCSRP